MTTEIPKKMRVVRLTKYVSRKLMQSDDLKSCFEVVEVDVPTPRPGEVLIRVERSPINPSDVGTMEGAHPADHPDEKDKKQEEEKKDKKSELPLTLGFEGSGQVVLSGGGMMAWYLTGKKVAFVAKSANAWGEYACIPAMQCLTIPDNISYEVASGSFVNPVTAICFIEIAKKRGLKTIAHTAAASQLGKMLIRLAQKAGIEVINIVRKDEQVKTLQAYGAKYILNSSDNDFVSKYKSLCQKTNCLLGFDAIGGDFTGIMLHNMPKHSEVQLYGGLAQQRHMKIEAHDILLDNKVLSGFYLGNFVQTLGTMGMLSIVKSVVDGMKAGDIKTEVVASFALQDLDLALKSYLNNMSAGKICIAPQLKESPKQDEKKSEKQDEKESEKK